MSYTSNLKDKIGSRARDIIISDCFLKQNGNRYSCPITQHKTDNRSVQWYEGDYKFYCHDCNKPYSIVDHAYSKEVDPTAYLQELAGVTPTPIQKKKPVETAATFLSQEGVEWMCNTRGITEDTLILYNVKADKCKIHFNYHNPQNEIVKVKYRHFPEKKFTAEAGGESILYGLHLLKNQKKLILCEGEIDAMTMYQILKLRESEEESQYLCSSLPNGANSLNETLVNASKEYLEGFERVIIVPDNDQAGQKMLSKAKDLLIDCELQVLKLPPGVNDVNEYYQNPDYNPCEILTFVSDCESKHKSLATSSDNIEPSVFQAGIRSGFLTHDANVSGLTPGNLTVLTGATGEGKTTLAKQMLMAFAVQKQKGFMYIGESTCADTVNDLAKLCPNKGEGDIEAFDNCVTGDYLFYPGKQLLERYKSEYGRYITLIDKSQLNEFRGKVFTQLLTEMYSAVRKHKTKLFVLDNLMTLCEADGNRLFTEQKDVTGRLKDFVNKTRTHVILVAHPKKGRGIQDVSGATEIINLADTIIRYSRIDSDFKKSIMKKTDDTGYMDSVLERASAVLRIEKCRKGGAFDMTFLEFDEKQGAVFDISHHPRAKEYESLGLWTRSMPNISDYF